MNVKWKIINEGMAKELGVSVNSDGLMLIDMDIARSYFEKHKYPFKNIPQFLNDNKIAKLENY